VETGLKCRAVGDDDDDRQTCGRDDAAIRRGLSLAVRLVLGQRLSHAGVAVFNTTQRNNPAQG